MRTTKNKAARELALHKAAKVNLNFIIAKERKKVNGSEVPVLELRERNPLSRADTRS